MNRVLTLEDSQQLLWTLISAPESVAATLAAPGPDGARLQAKVEAQIAGDDRLSAVDRVDIYANMYFYRLHDCLAQDFSAVRAVIGDARFHNLITDYLLMHPSAHPSLRFAGSRLPEMLRTHKLSHRWPFLADLARLEWALLDAFDAPDAQLLRESDLDRVSPSDWDTLRFRLTPSVQLLDADWDVDAMWSRIQHGERPDTPARTPTALVVWRRDFRVFHRAVDRLERDALVDLREGKRFGVLCEHIAAAVVGGDDATAAALGLLQRWIAEGLLARIINNPG
jgi:hypothetical protein